MSIRTRTTRLGCVSILEDRPTGKQLMISTVNRFIAIKLKPGYLHHSDIDSNTLNANLRSRRNTAYELTRELARRGAIEILLYHTAIVVIGASRKLKFYVGNRNMFPYADFNEFHKFLLQIASNTDFESMTKLSKFDEPFYSKGHNAIDLRIFYPLSLRKIPTVVIEGPNCD